MEKATGKIWNRIIAEKNKEISALMKMIHHLQKKKVDMFINVNNHYEGSAPLTIKKIVDRLNT